MPSQEARRKPLGASPAAKHTCEGILESILDGGTGARGPHELWKYSFFETQRIGKLISESSEIAILIICQWTDILDILKMNIFVGF